MAFYKALEKIELKKHSEASENNFGVVFYSKGSLKSTLNKTLFPFSLRLLCKWFILAITH